MSWTDDAVVVCSTRSYFNDDLVSFCQKCFRVVYLRPYMTEHEKRVCWPCVEHKLRDPNQIFGIHAEALKEIRSLMGSKTPRDLDNL